MNYKKILITSILLLLLFGVRGISEVPEIESPEDGAIKNQTEFILNWTSVDGAECYWVYEEYKDESDYYYTYDSSYSLPKVSTKDGDYTYEIEASNYTRCVYPGDSSDSVTVTIDTTPPSLISKSPVGDRVDVDLDEIIMEFDSGLSEKMDKNYTEKDFKTTPGINGNLRWDDEETLIYDIEEGFNLNYSKEYEISLEAKDKAGNTEHFSWSFETR